MHCKGTPSLQPTFTLITSHLQLAVEQLHVRYEDQTHSKAPVAVGLTLASLATTLDGDASTVSAEC